MRQNAANDTLAVAEPMTRSDPPAIAPSAKRPAPPTTPSTASAIDARARALPDTGMAAPGAAPTGAPGRDAAKGRAVRPSAGASNPAATPAPAGAATTPRHVGDDPVALIAAHLAGVWDRLAQASGPAGLARLAAILSRRLGGVVDAALRDVRLRMGALALASEDAAERRHLQEAALAWRPEPDKLVADLVRTLGTSELLALLTVACVERDPASVEALRCQGIVFGGRQLMAREAALDLASGQLDATLRARTDTVVGRAARAAFRSPAWTTATARFGAPRAGTDRASTEAATSPSDQRPGIPERLFGASLAAGDIAGAARVLAKSARVDAAVIDRAVSARDGRALAGLVWRAGFDPSLGAAAQIVLGRLAPDEIVAGEGVDSFGIRPAQMAWAVETLAAG